MTHPDSPSCTETRVCERTAFSYLPGHSHFLISSIASTLRNRTVFPVPLRADVTTPARCGLQAEPPNLPSHWGMSVQFFRELMLGRMLLQQHFQGKCCAGRQASTVRFCSGPERREFTELHPDREKPPGPPRRLCTAGGWPHPKSCTDHPPWGNASHLTTWLTQRGQGTSKAKCAHSPTEANSLKSNKAERLTHLPHTAPPTPPDPRWLTLTSPRSSAPRPPEGKLFGNNAACLLPCPGTQQWLDKS